MRNSSQTPRRDGSILVPAALDRFGPFAPGVFRANPAPISLPKYSEDYNHRELDGHRFWKHTYRVAPIEWVLLLTWRARSGDCEMGFRRALTTSESLHRARASTAISAKNSVRRCDSKSITRWTSAQKFWIICAGSHTIYCVPAAELFLVLRGEAHETTNRTASNLPCKLGN